MMTFPSDTEIIVRQAAARAEPVLVPDPDVMVVGTVRAPIEQVWELFRPFDCEIMKWWPIYDWVELEAPYIDKVGAVRHFKANGRIYKERLVVRDDKTHTEQYAFISSDVPLPIKSILTTVQMLAKGPTETEVRWSSKTDMNPLLLPLVKYIQREAYHGAIEALARYFNPVSEILEVKVLGAELPMTSFLVPRTYVVAQLEGAPPQRTGIKLLTTRPKWNESMQFNVGVFDRQVRLSVWDARFGRDNLLGTATVPFDKLTNGSWVEQSVLLEGPSSGQLTLSMRYKPEFEVLRSVMSLAKTLGGGAVGRAVPLLGQLGFEIGMLDTTVASFELTARDYLSKKLGMGMEPTKMDSAEQQAGALLLHLRRAVGGVQTTILGLTAQLLALAQQMMRTINEGDLAVYGYERYPRMPQIPDVPLENLPRMVKGLPRQEILTPSKLGGMVQRGLEYAYSEFDLVTRYKDAVRKGTDPFEAFFDAWVRRPNPVVDQWKDDAEFCRQLLQGVNPLKLKMVRSMDEIPPSMLALSAQGRSLQELIHERRLFILDYSLLSELKLYRKMVFYAPIALVYRELLSEGESRLNLVGIQLTRDAGPNVVYTVASSPPNRYLYAKIQVACADNQYHQFISHLGLAHLATEPMVIAHHNAFYGHPSHPIGKLLAPHLKETIGINYLARQTLVAAPDVAFTDTTFSPGTAQALQLFLMAWEQYDFFGNSFPEDLLNRGFDEGCSDGVQGYYFRDDGFKIWRALESYASEVVDAVYSSDTAVAADPVLQAWAKESSNPNRADIPGFPQAITSRALLVKTLTTIIFHASAFHSSVNFPQCDYLAYVPNRPDSTFAKMPEGEEDISMDFILWKAMPNFFISNFQISFAILLTLPSDAPLSKLDALAKEFPDIHKRFKANLAKISDELAERNMALESAGKQPYPYLMPDRVASSVAI